MYPKWPISSHLRSGAARLNCQQTVASRSRLVRYGYDPTTALSGNVRKVWAVSYTHLTLPTNREV